MKIGLETHLQLNTESKLFCSCASRIQENEKPNSRTCPTCLGHPGSKPVLNKKALKYAIKLCKALGCEIEKNIFFSRKTYFYPDMAKNYQITQYEIPLGRNGFIKLKNGKKVEIERIHIEEDPAALLHEGSISESDHVLIDYNRSGNPLVEIVTSPCMESPAEARMFLNELIRIVKYLKIFDEKEGNMKSDLNISIDGHPRAEIKNVSGFKDGERALNFEIVRQKIAVQQNKETFQETRAWDPTSQKTISLRTKETENDYGYIFDPDLVQIDTWEIQKQVILPELAHVKAERYIKNYNLNETDAEVICSELELAELFEKIIIKIEPILTAQWLRRELLRVLNYNNISINDMKFGHIELIELLAMLQEEIITKRVAQKIMEQLMEKSFSPMEYVKQNNLVIVNNNEELTSLCQEVIKDNPDAVKDYINGEIKSLHFLVGQVMKLSKGKANAQKVTEKIKELCK